MTEKKLSQVELLYGRMGRYQSKYGASMFNDALTAANQLVLWLNYLSESHKTGVGDKFLAGARSSIMESVGCISMGLIRPALFAQRAQIDTVLAWLFFRNHEVELDLVNRYGKGFLLKSGIVSYLGEYIPGYTTRYRVLSQCRVRKLEEPYGPLSAHIHCQSDFTIPIARNLGDLVGTDSVAKDAVKLQGEVAEYLGDVLVSVFADQWASFPDDLFSIYKQRLSGAQQAAVFGNC